LGGQVKEMSIKNNIVHYRQELEGKNCELIAVSKTHPAEKVAEAYAAGQRLFGENKVQEMTAKYEALPKDIQWHLIGHLQSNKVKYIAPYVSLIHSVDSAKLLEEINKQGKKINRVISCLLQVHIAQEETKFGFDEPELLAFIASPEINQFTHVKIEGLMGMATLTDNQDQVRNEFRHLKKIFTAIHRQADKPAAVSMKHLSMGMSADYRIALEEGSTMVRIGTALFGER
jgi:pyridoxal phosphate enzyme (YggS family)